jgi:hypothetical protein
MKLLTSIKVLLLFALAVSVLGHASGYDCQETEVTSLDVKAKEKFNLCFAKHDSNYFISQNCLTLECKFTEQLKKRVLAPEKESGSYERPGRKLCKELKGMVEKVAITGKGEAIRCIFPDDLSSVSLNMLESWNGKIFTGPQPPVKP